ncbi:MAG TPA: hypothetical protein VL200_15420 [Lacunisphaera sp.]|jgi:hypothetical protein|nr:hypothetical protein [Lacunisphaera sp.]
MDKVAAMAAAQRVRVFLERTLALVAAAAFFLVVHNYGINLLPYHRQVLAPEDIKPEEPGPSFGYVYPFHEGVPDRTTEMRSRLRLLEDDQPYAERTTSLAAIREVGGGRFAHLPDRVVFATPVNSDPRSNGHIYRLEWPMLYSRAVGRGAALVLLAALLGLVALRRPAPRAAPVSVAAGGWSPAGRWWWWAAAVVFAAGLYCNTGTRAPYAITFYPYIDPATGHAYNQDHVHFRVLFDFVDGKPRSVWDKALLLRRILYPVIAYPAMKLFGFAAGGVGMNLLLNLAGFLACGYWLRRRVGERGALFAAWVLATYPGFAYWAGMPYQYALIAPGSLLLSAGLAEIAGSTSWKTTLGWSAAMGLLYLAYDFAVFFLPATVLLLLWRRRWLQAAAAAAVQALPLVCWMLALKYVFGQSLENSNTGVYRNVLGSLSAVQDWGQWLRQRADLWEIGWAAFFGSNFVFLPALFLGALLANRWTARIGAAADEVALWLAVAGLFLFINLGEKTGGWDMSGNWIARLYQPAFAAMVFFLARWWQALPAAPWRKRLPCWLGVAAACGGNLLIVFGPILGDPLGISDEAFYRFYTHSYSSRTTVYHQMLRELPRQTFGFGHAQPRGSQ